MIGVDIVDISRVKLYPSFIDHILTTEEKEEYKEKRTEYQQKEFLAARFAAKEAIFKATEDPDYLHYTILHHKNGCPYIKDHPELEISISHDGGMAVAFVMAVQTPL